MQLLTFSSVSSEDCFADLGMVDMLDTDDLFNEFRNALTSTFDPLYANLLKGLGL